MPHKKPCVPRVGTHECPSCNVPTVCGMEQGKSITACWCYSLKLHPMSTEATKCLCPKCLKGAV